MFSTRPTRLLPALLATLLLGGVASPAWAYRPFDSTNAEVAEPGEFVIKAGTGFINSGGLTFVYLPAVEFDLGIASNWQLGLEGVHRFATTDTSPDPRSRLVEDAFTIKTVWVQGSLQDKPGVSFASKVAVLLPNINEQPGTGAEARLILSNRWPELTMHVNAGYQYSRAGQSAVIGGLILEGPHAWTVRPVGEFTVNKMVSQSATTVLTGLLGFLWRVRNNLVVDAAYKYTRADLNANELRLGLTWGFPVWGSGEAEQQHETDE